tara:strand:+ start:2670 stop:3233 length:564 start_codon:yes stop_codon:yes gene_type:complete
MFENYVKIYHNAVPDVFCDKLVEKYENNPQQYYHQDRKNEARNWRMSFSQIHLQDHDIWKDDVKYLMDTYQMYIRQYREDCDIIDNMWPLKYSFETIRMKRYLPNNKDMFGNHVDVTDYKTARRFLVFFLYINDNEAGETSFSKLNFNASCKKGSLLMFPPLWPWLHAGEKPINKPKYIVGSYLHYV